MPRHRSGRQTALLDAAKRISPRGLDFPVDENNARSIHFYEKHGFKIKYAGEDENPVSDIAVSRMARRAT